MVDPNGRPDSFWLVIMGPTGQPIDPDGTVDNASVACFSNCGKYKFPSHQLETATKNRFHMLPLEDILRR